MSPHVTVTDWVEMFRAIGLTEQQMHQWHELFERRHPQAHEAFLQWLGLGPDEVRRIRDGSNAPAS